MAALSVCFQVCKVGDGQQLIGQFRSRTVLHKPLLLYFTIEESAVHVL